MTRALVVSICCFLNISFAHAECADGAQVSNVPTATAHRLVSEFVAKTSLERLSRGGFVDDGHCRVRVSTAAADGAFKVEVTERVMRANFGRHVADITQMVPVRLACAFAGDPATVGLKDVISLGDDQAEGFFVSVNGPKRFLQVPNPNVLAFYVPKVIRCEARD